MTVRRCRDAPPRDTTPLVDRRQRVPREAADVPCCARRMVRRRGRWRTPLWAARPRDRSDSCTTAHRPGFVAHHAKPARWCSVPGFARSSRQTVATLGAACLQNGAATTGAHTVAKAVLTGLAPIVRLVGALHATLLRRPQHELWDDITDRATGARSDGRSRGGCELAQVRAGHQVRQHDGLSSMSVTAASVRAPTDDDDVLDVHIVWTSVWTVGGLIEGGPGERR